MKTYDGSRCIDPCSLDLGTTCRWVVSYTIQPFYPRYPFIRGWVGPRADLDEVKKSKFFTLPGHNSDPSVVQTAASRTDCYRGSYRNLQTGFIWYFRKSLTEIYTLLSTVKQNLPTTMNPHQCERAEWIWWDGNQEWPQPRTNTALLWKTCSLHNL
jgi:hypothetical protein